MKKILLVLLLCLARLISYAGDSVCYVNQPYIMKFISNESSVINGHLSLKLKVRSLQNQLYRGKILLRTPAFFTAVPVSTITSANHSIDDTFIVEYDLVYNQQTLPFYSMEISATIIADTISGPSVNPERNVPLKRDCAIYFTPYSTVETWDVHEFAQLKRVWIGGSGDENATRITFPKSQIPVSDIPSNYTPSDSDTIYLVRVDGLGYSIPMLHPDTANYYSIHQNTDDDKYGDNPPQKESMADDCGILWKRFKGRVENLRFYTWYKPDPTTTVPNPPLMKIWLKNVSIGLYVDRLANGRIGNYKTDDEGYVVDNYGNRSFNFDFCASVTNNSRKVYFSVEMRDPDNYNKIKVEYASSPWSTYESLTTYNFELSYSASYVTLTIGNQVGNTREFEVANYHLGYLYTMVRWARDITNYETNGTFSLPHDFRAKVITDPDNDLRTAHYVSGKHTIEIRYERAHNERTIFHEYGHHVNHEFSNHSDWANTGGEHRLDYNNRNHDVTMEEGTADGYAMIMDEMTRARTDGESGFGEGFAPYHQNIISSYSPFPSTLSHSFLSEEILARVMLDLWDGSYNYSLYNNNSLIADYQDAYASGGVEDFEMSFKDIYKAIHYQSINNGTWSVTDMPALYYNITKGRTCGDITKIKRLFEHNLINNDHLRLNSDEIFSEFTQTVTGYNESGGTFSPNNFAYTYKDENISVLDGVNQSFNSCNYRYMYGSTEKIYHFFGIFNMTDDLLIKNSAVLYINGSMGPRFFNQSTPAGYSYDGLGQIQIQINYCGNSSLVVNDGGKIEVGGNSTTLAGTFIIKSGSTLTLGQSSTSTGTLKINENSKLIIEEGATLIINPGAQIELNGDNAILEIRGQLLINNNATFTYNGGTAGSGFVRFYNNSSSLVNILSGTNAQFILTGSGISDKVLELTGGESIRTNSLLALFKIENGFIAADVQSRLNIYCPLTMNNVIMDRIVSTANKHRGILTHGQSGVTLNKVTVRYGETGLNGTSTGNKNIMTVTCSNFKNCDKGIYTYNVPLSITSSYIKDNVYEGWLFEGGGSMAQNIINDVYINNNGTDGVIFNLSSSGVSLKITSSTISNNGQTTGGRGVYMNGGTLISRCTNYSTNGTGIYAENLNLDLGSATDYGSNVFTSNTYAGININFLNSISINGAKNKFTYNTANGQMAIRGSAGLGCPYSISATDNYWNNISYTPVSGTDYLISYICLSFIPPTQTLTLTTSPTLITFSSCSSVLNACNGINELVSNNTNYDSEVIKPQPAIKDKPDNTQKQEFTPSWKIRLSKAKDSVFANKVKILADSILIDSLPSKTIKSLSKLLKSRNKNEIKDNKAAVDIAYTELMEGVGKVFDYYSRNKMDSTVLNEVCNTATDIQIDLLEKTANLETSYSDSFRYSVDNIITLRDQGKRKEALQNLSNMTLWVQKNDISKLNQWECWIRRELKLIEDSLSIEEIKNWDSCKTEEEISKKTVVLGFGKNSFNPDNLPSIRIYPNPANGILNIKLFNQSRSLLQVNIIDVHGRQVYSMNPEYVNPGENIKTISTIHLTPGIYMVHIINDEISYTEKVLIAN